MRLPLSVNIAFCAIAEMSICMNCETFISATAVLLTLGCAATDLRSGMIPNQLTLWAMAMALVGRWVLLGHSGLIVGLLGLFGTALAPWLLFRTSRGSGIGGGDVKLFAALGALLGPAMGLQVLTASCLLLLVFACGLLACRGRLWRTLAQSFSLALQPFAPRRFARQMDGGRYTSLRMGPFIALATMLMLTRPRLQEVLPWLFML